MQYILEDRLIGLTLFPGAVAEDGDVTWAGYVIGTEDGNSVRLRPVELWITAGTIDGEGIRDFDVENLAWLARREYIHGGVIGAWRWVHDVALPDVVRNILVEDLRANEFDEVIEALAENMKGVR